jgi:predicted protein tyrosine phosphatase
MRLLFVCSQNRFRSPTAEAIFSSYEGIEVASAGLNNDAPTTVTGDLIEWADIIFVMEKTHLNRLNKRFRTMTRGKRVVVLGVPDDFEFMDAALVELLERRVRPHLRGTI